MKVDKLVNKIIEKRAEIMKRENREPSFIVYVDFRTWYDMMGEIREQKNLMVYSMHKSMGKSIGGHKIYRVDDDNEHIKIFEETP